MKLRYFAHSWLSDWNHGNAHFLRGFASALVRRGHDFRGYEAVPAPAGGWSLAHLWDEPRGPAAIAQMRAAYPELDLKVFAWTTPHPPSPAVAQAGLAWVRSWKEELRGVEAVIVHEWNPPELINLLLDWRRRLGFFLLLHDTHHRALSHPEAIHRLRLRELDGVLAFGESLRRTYEQAGVRHAYLLHEAADVERFPPRPPAGDEEFDLIWIGNWGDEERTRELQEFLLAPARAARARVLVHGVRYPPAALAQLAASGCAWQGYLPNLDVPRANARARLALHVPRRPYATALSGIPTIRVFETLACGQALLSAPWPDSEGLFEAGRDYRAVRDSDEMAAAVMQLLRDPEQRNQLGRQGAATVRARHTCAHRAQEWEAIWQDLSHRN